MSHKTCLGFLLLGLYHQAGNLMLNGRSTDLFFFKFIPTVSLCKEKSIRTVGVNENYRKMRGRFGFLPIS